MLKKFFLGAVLFASNVVFGMSSITIVVNDLKDGSYLIEEEGKESLSVFFAQTRATKRELRRGRLHESETTIAGKFSVLDEQSLTVYQGISSISLEVRDEAGRNLGHVVRRNRTSIDDDREYDIYSSQGERVATVTKGWFSDLFITTIDTGEQVASIDRPFFLWNHEQTVKIPDPELFYELGVDPIVLALLAVWEKDQQREKIHDGHTL